MKMKKVVKYEDEHGNKGYLTYGSLFSNCLEPLITFLSIVGSLSTLLLAVLGGKAALDGDTFSAALYLVSAVSIPIISLVGGPYVYLKVCEKIWGSEWKEN